MAKIAIEINCGKATCGACNSSWYHMARGAMCGVFNKELKTKGNSLMRLPECKQAEVKDE